MSELTLHNYITSLKKECNDRPEDYHRIILWSLQELFDLFYETTLHADEFHDYCKETFKLLDELDRKFGF